jgi:hypothetical protein
MRDLILPNKYKRREQVERRRENWRICLEQEGYYRFEAGYLLGKMASRSGYLMNPLVDA